MDFNLIVLISFRILLIFFRNISLLRSPTYIILIHFRAKEQENTHAHQDVQVDKDLARPAPREHGRRPPAQPSPVDQSACRTTCSLACCRAH